jgi:hypothetical protein
MDETGPEKWEDRLALMSVARNPRELCKETGDLLRLAKVKADVKTAGVEAKLSELKTTAWRTTY